MIARKKDCEKVMKVIIYEKYRNENKANQNDPESQGYRHKTKEKVGKDSIKIEQNKRDPSTENI